MKKLFHDLFYIPKYSKMSERAFLSNLTLLIVGIVLCLSSVALTAYAYYSCSFDTPVQTITAGFFDCTVTVQKVGEDNAPLAEWEQKVLEGSDIRLDEGRYQISVGKTAASTASTGFCMVKAEGLTFHTVQLNDPASPLVFILQIQGGGANVTFTPTLGTSSYFVSTIGLDGEDLYIGNAGQMETVVVNVAPQNESPAPEVPDETQQETTVPESIPEETTRPEYVLLAEGETVWDIEQKYGIDRERIKAYNNIEDATSLPVGYKLYLPPDDWQMPTTQPTAPSTEATEPVTQPTVPSTEVTEPATEATEPSTEPTEPATEPTEPSTEPTEPSAEPTEPSTESTQPTTEVTQPTTQATEAPSETTEPSTEATDPVTEPTVSSTEETDPVQESSEPSTQPEQNTPEA